MKYSMTLALTLFKLFCKSEIFSYGIIIVVSSAYWIMSGWILAKLWTYNDYKIGLNIAPSGTPRFIGINDENWESFLTEKNLLFRKFSSNWRKCPLNPKEARIVHSVSWFTMSNALERSRNKAHDFKLCNLFSSTFHTASFIEKFFLKPN